MKQVEPIGLELAAAKFSYPSCITFDNAGSLYVADAAETLFSGGEPKGRIWRIDPDGKHCIFQEGWGTPITGLLFHNNGLYISEGGRYGRISHLNLDSGEITTIYHFPGPGNAHTNEIVVGPDSKLYFSQGAMTNEGIIGLDAYQMPWIRRLPQRHDLPGYDVVLTGVNIETDDPLSNVAGAKAQTGAFVPFGTGTTPGQRIPGQVPCSASIMRCDPDGSNLELVAWGLRNAYAMDFLPDGRLIAIDQGGDDRGSRPIGNVPDLLFEVHKGAWYGWPDFVGTEPVTDAKFLPQRGPQPSFVLANHQELPPLEEPLMHFPAHIGAVKLAVFPETIEAYAGQLVVALFGDEFPLAAPSAEAIGREVVRVDPSDWSIHPLIPSGISRPIDLQFDAIHRTLYILDFGSFDLVGQKGDVAEQARSGKLWRFQF